MNITFVTTHLTVFVGGGKFLMDYANKFCEYGHTVSVIAQKVDSKKYKFNSKISVIEIGGTLPLNPLHWFFFNTIKNKYLRVLNNLNCELMISLNFPTNYFCALSHKKNGIKHIYVCLEPIRYFHDYKFYSTAPFFLKTACYILKIFFRRLDIESATSADSIICISNFTKRQVQKIYGRDSQVHHIGIETNDFGYQATNFNLREKLAIKDKNAPIIFALGISHHLKGAKELMIIFSKIIENIPNSVLLIAGWRIKEYEKNMRYLANKLKIPQKNIFFYGFIEQRLLDTFYRNSTISAYTAIDESYGYIPLESMKNGIPVVAFEGGPSDTIIDGQTGYVIKNTDLLEFAEKTIKLLRDSELYQRFSENAKIHVKNNFNIEKQAKNLEMTMQDVIFKTIINIKN